MDTNNFPTSFYFELSFNHEKIPFQEVSGISARLGIEEIVAGGENRFKYRLPGTPMAENLTLKRGFVAMDSNFNTWCLDAVGGGLKNAIVTNDISISLLSTDKTVHMKWDFYNAYPVKYSFAEFKSQEDQCAIETIELAYSHFQISPIPKG